MSTLINDIRFAMRGLLKSGSVVWIAVLALALGIGANTAIFSVVNTVLLSPLPFHEPDGLVTLLRPDSFPISPADFADFHDRARSFESVGAAEGWSASLTAHDTPEQIVGLHVSSDLFTMLGVAPIRGRTFDENDFGAGRDHVLVIGYELWQRAFGGAQDVVGQSVQLDHQSYTVVGVMPQGFHFAPFWITQSEMWAPIDFPARISQRGFNSIRAFARLRPGVSMRQAQAEVDQICASLAAAYPMTNTDMKVPLESLTEKSVGRLRPALELMLGAVGMVLLIACANVANLALARATARQKEIAIRFSLGAQRGRIVRQFVTESLALSFAGGVVGLLLATWGVRAFQMMLRPDAGSFSTRLQRWNEIGMHLPVLLFTLAIVIATGILSGLAPAFAASRGDLNDGLKDAGRGSTGSRSGFRKFLVAAEIAVAMVLLIGAGLLTRSFAKLRSIDPGFDPANVVTMTVSVAGRPDYVGPAREVLYRSVIDRVKSVPGVSAASMTNHLPIAGDQWSAQLTVEGRPVPAPGHELNTVYRVTRPDYFATMRAALLKGRDFTDHDDVRSPPVAIVNESIARRVFPNQDAIGKRITLGPGGDGVVWMTIIGVVRDIKQNHWTDAPANEVHLPFLQNNQFLNGKNPWTASMTLVVRTKIDAEAAMPAIKSAIWSIDRNLPLSQVQTLDHAIGNATWESRFSLLLAGMFSSLALALAMIGIYGVMAYEVAQRTHEIGIRMALGAARSGIVVMIARQSLTVALIGIAVGLAAAAGLVRLMQAMLYQVDVLDPITFAAVALLVLLVAGAAAVIPARNAMNVDPMIALRRD